MEPRGINWPKPPKRDLSLQIWHILSVVTVVILNIYFLLSNIRYDNNELYIWFVLLSTIVLGKYVNDHFIQLSNKDYNSDLAYYHLLTTLHNIDSSEAIEELLIQEKLNICETLCNSYPHNISIEYMLSKLNHIHDMLGVDTAKRKTICK